MGGVRKHKEDPGLRVVGECKQCGACCRLGIQWITCEIAEFDDYLEWARVRGRTITQVGESHNGRFAIIQAEYPDLCPHLDENNLCKLHGDKKPAHCRKYPNPKDDMTKSWDIDQGLVLPKGCGFRYVEDDDD